MVSITARENHTLILLRFGNDIKATLVSMTTAKTVASRVTGSRANSLTRSTLNNTANQQSVMIKRSLSCAIPHHFDVLNHVSMSMLLCNCGQSVDATAALNSKMVTGVQSG